MGRGRRGGKSTQKERIDQSLQPRYFGDKTEYEEGYKTGKGAVLPHHGRSEVWQTPLRSELI